MYRACLYLIAGWSGFFVMGVELLGGRLLAPFFGSSIYVWGAIITVFMLALSLGYLAGGRASLAAPSLRRLALILLAGAAATVPVLLFGDALLERLSAQVPGPAIRIAAGRGAAVSPAHGHLGHGVAVRGAIARRRSRQRRPSRRQALFRLDFRQCRRHAG